MTITRVSRRGFIGSAAALGLAPMAAAGGQSPSGGGAQARVEKDVVFGRGGDTDLRCDIYHPPPGGAKRMALIHYYGGGFVGGSKETLGGKVTPFAARGYVVVAAQYRLAGAAKWPAPLEDVKAAIRWTRANAARLDIDPAHIGIAGYSAGAFMALMGAGTQNRPEFEGTGGNPGVSTALSSCFGFYPPIEIRPRADGTPHVLMPAGSDLAAHVAASPTTYAKAFPPTVLFHGVADATLPVEGSVRFFGLLKEANVPVELHTYAGVPHEFDTHPEFADEVSRTGDFFIERYVLHPRTYPPFGGGRRGGGPPPR